MSSNGNESIRFEGVGKQYRFWGYHSFTVRDEFQRLARAVNPAHWIRKPSPVADEKVGFWALRDIDLSVAKGEAVGIIGPNGAGKSTMLKLMSGIIYPTKGRIAIRGRVGSLIELGAGLHGELTGRDNIYMYGSLIGMNRRELREKFDSIVDFAELGKFIDEPVKYFSSGMELRLAFSITIHLDHEILLVDEVLGVGDEKFYRKSLDAMSRFIKSGRTVVMVSHNLAAISNFCRRVILLENGRMIADGAPQDIILNYQSKVSRSQGVAVKADETRRRWGTYDVFIREVRFIDQGQGQSSGMSLSGRSWSFELDYETKAPLGSVVFGMVIHNNKGEIVYGENNGLDHDRPARLQGAGTVVFKTPALSLPAGKYFLSVYAQDVSKTIVYDWHDQSYPFEVVEARPLERLGQLYLLSTWEYRQ